MKQTVISVAHCLVLWPVNNVLTFSVLTNGVSMDTKGKGYELEITPGSLTVSDKVDTSGIYTKKYSFKVPRPDSAKTAQLRLLASSGYYIATYTDETGQQRVAGSKDWPLSLSVEYSGGLLQCTLQGKGTDVDPYTL